MKKLHEAIVSWKKWKQWSNQYRLCWFPFPNGGGLYTVMEIFDDELDKIDPKKCEIIK